MKFCKKITYQGRVYELPEYLELQLNIKHFQAPDEPLIPLGSRIKNGRLWIDDGWSEPRGRFTLSKAPKFLGIYKEHAEYLLDIKIKPNSPVIKHFLYFAPRNLIGEMICDLGKRHFDSDNEHFWHEIKKQLKVIDEASD